MSLLTTASVLAAMLAHPESESAVTGRVVAVDFTQEPALVEAFGGRRFYVEDDRARRIRALNGSPMIVRARSWRAPIRSIRAGAAAVMKRWMKAASWGRGGRWAER
jgi:hypothetical protein